MIAGLSLKLAESSPVYYMINNSQARIPLACIYHFCSRPISVSLLRFAACMVNESIPFTFDSFFYMFLQQSFYLIGMNVWKDGFAFGSNSQSQCEAAVFALAIHDRRETQNDSLWLASRWWHLIDGDHVLNFLLLETGVTSDILGSHRVIVRVR